MLTNVMFAVMAIILLLAIRSCAMQAKECEQRCKPHTCYNPSQMTCDLTQEFAK